MKLFRFIVFAIAICFLPISCKKEKTPVNVNDPNKDLPVVNASYFRAIEDSSAISEYTVNGAHIKDMGVCWDTLTDPTIDKPHTVQNGASGQFQDDVRGLKPNTTYYLRAYARDYAEDVVYSKTISFRTVKFWIPSGQAAIRQMIVHNNRLFGFGSEGGIYVSADNGSTWNLAYDAQGSIPISLISDGTVLMASYIQGTILSANNGASWIIPSLNSSPLALTVHHNKLVAAGYNNIIFTSADHGITWIAAGNTPSNEQFGLLYSNGSILLAASAKHCYRSADDGATWQAADNGMTNSYPINYFGSLGNKLFASAAPEDYQFTSSDNGQSWAVYADSQTGTSGFTNYGNAIFSSLNQNIFVSRDAGASWQQFTDSQTHSFIQSVVVKDGMLVVSDGAYIYRLPIGF